VVVAPRGRGLHRGGECGETGREHREPAHRQQAADGANHDKWTVDDVDAEGDRVVLRATNSCVQDEFFGVPAYRRRQVFTATFTLRIADGLVAETWRYADDRLACRPVTHRAAERRIWSATRGQSVMRGKRTRRDLGTRVGRQRWLAREW